MRKLFAIGTLVSLGALLIWMQAPSRAKPTTTRAQEFGDEAVADLTAMAPDALARRPQTITGHYASWDVDFPLEADHGQFAARATLKIDKNPGQNHPQKFAVAALVSDPLTDEVFDRQDFGVITAHPNEAYRHRYRQLFDLPPGRWRITFQAVRQTTKGTWMDPKSGPNSSRTITVH